MTVAALLQLHLVAFSIITLLYVAIAGGAYLYFSCWRREEYRRFKIQPESPEPGQIARELRYSAATCLIFSSVVYLSGSNWYKIYYDIDEYGWAYFFLSALLITLFHDAYFYWLHRLLHTRCLFFLHKVHHQFTNPTPWTAFAFHPVEALLHTAVVPLLALAIPLHPLAIMLFLAHMTLANVIGHCGFEAFPRGSTTHFWLGTGNNATHHNMHHQYISCNYGLYFNFWDRWMGTNHPDYHQTFELIKSRPEEPLPRV